MHESQRNTAEADAPIRVAFLQPSLAKYRVPVFRELAARPGIDPVFFCGDDADIPSVDADGFEVVRTPLIKRRVLGMSLLEHPMIDGLSRDPQGFNVLVFPWNIRYPSLLPALLRARRKRIPVILRGHGYSKNERWPLQQFRNRLARLAAAVLFYDRRTADRFAEHGLAAERLFVAPNTIDQSPVQAARDAVLSNPAALRAFQEEHGLTGKRVLLYVSRILPANRLDLLVDALPQLLRKEPETVVVLIGKENLAAKQLQEHAEAQGVADRLRFLGAIYEEEKLAPWFLTADAFVYPENIGLSILHAFGYGLPVVTCDDLRVQNPEIIAMKPGVNGLTYRRGDATDLAAKLAGLLADADGRRELASAAHRTATQEYTLTAMVDGLVDAIRYAALRNRGAEGG